MESSVSVIGAAECKPHQYDVFINHRGPDVKKTFVAHLDDALRWDGFRPFLDAKDIGKGRHVFKSIDQALKGACVHVAIFSKRYAESKYCLNELCDMLNSGKPILPVFYQVNAEDLRWIEKGPFVEGFAKHMKRGRREEVEKWKKALCKVADYRGFRLDEVNGDEMQLIRSILVEVRSALPTTLLPAKQRYGRQSSMKNLVKTFECVSVLGLVGVGGIGKTTLAIEIYNHFVSCGQFERYCFLKDVRSSELSQLQHNLLKDLGHRLELRSISPQDYRRSFDGLMWQRVLVVVDDIDHPSQFEALIPDIQILSSGSRVVITSRQRDVLRRVMAGTASREVFEVPRLTRHNSRCLFNRHAFLSETASEGFAELAAKVADACGGHALSLEIIGASLFDKKGSEDRVIWEEAVKSLQENKEVFGKLRSSYDNLPTDGDKAMFRDIACFWNGKKKKRALTFWNSCGSCSGAHCSTSKTPALVLRRLMDRSLVKIDFEDRLWMHDVLCYMGRNIVKEEARGSEEWTHLWDATSAAKVLGCKKRNSSTRGMSLAAHTTNIVASVTYESPKDGAVSFKASDLTGMEELHLLILDGCHEVVPDDFSSWPQALRLLQWRQGFFARLPSQLNLPNLVVLDLCFSDRLTHLWEHDAHVQLPQLQMLELSYCGELVSLPDSIVELVSLKYLIMPSCQKLQQLPEELGKLTNLEYLDVSDCSLLSKLPASIGGLRMLKCLNMNRSGVEDLPAEFGALSCLETLDANGLRTVRETFHGLEALAQLDIVGGSGDLGDLGALAALEQIFLDDHATISTLPKSLGNLQWLFRLVIRRCPELLTVEALPESLEELDLSECEKLTEIPSLATMRSLVELMLRNCKSLRHLYGLECVTSLKIINVSGCTAIEDRRIDGMVYSALRRCNVSGSKVGVAYNNKWLEREPPLQVISWLGDAIAPLSNGYAKEYALPQNEWNTVLRATITSKAECVALIWYLAINQSGVDSCHSFDWNVEVWRGGQLFIETRCRPVSQKGHRSQVHLFTMRRESSVVLSLQLGDQIFVRLKAFKASCLTVVEGGVYVVHNEDEKLVMAVNSEVLSPIESEDLALQFGRLVLGANVRKPFLQWLWSF